MIPWQNTLGRIRELQTELMRSAPWHDAGLVPNPGASPLAIETAEARIGRPLPPSYRAFLRQHDGWPRFFDGATLLGSATLGLRVYEDAARSTFEAANTPVTLSPPLRARPQRLVTFGADLALTTLFAFDPSAVDAHGEYEVVVWIGEIGMRRESFPSFLELIHELCESDDARAPGEPLRRSA